MSQQDKDKSINSLAQCLVTLCHARGRAEILDPDQMISALGEAMVRIAVGVAYGMTMNAAEREELITNLPGIAEWKVRSAIRGWDFAAFEKYRAEQEAARH